MVQKVEFARCAHSKQPLRDRPIQASLRRPVAGVRPRFSQVSYGPPTFRGLAEHDASPGHRMDVKEKTVVGQDTSYIVQGMDHAPVSHSS